MDRDRPTVAAALVELLWVPLGAGTPVVQVCGRVFEALSALLQHRARSPLFHSALEVTVPAGRYVIEVTPTPDGDGDRRGVVATGPVGVRWAGRLRLFRYEVRRWRDGVVPDAEHAVGGPVAVTEDPAIANRVLDLVPSVPTATWGRHELARGDMWNSNSVCSWLLASAGIDTDRLQPPDGGRAPGWTAGLVVAARGSSPAQQPRLASTMQKRLPSGSARTTKSGSSG